MSPAEKIHKSIQDRCRIQPGMLVKTKPATFVIQDNEPGKLALVTKRSPACSFDRDYEGAEEHIFYVCEPLDGTPSFVDYVCNLKQIS
jgi:3'-phosphoadenosine 5'-phosphosulfate (PAPS) 3'-phosphatase